MINLKSINPRMVSKFMWFSAVFPFVFLAVVLLAGWYFVNQQLSAQKISDYSWEFGSIKEGSISFKKIQFVFDNRYEVHLEQAVFSKAITKENKPLLLSLQSIDIDSLNVNILDNQNQTDKNEPPIHLNQIIHRIQQPLLNLSNQPTWLGFLPKAIQIKTLHIKAPCKTGSCQINGLADMQINLAENPLELVAHIKLQDNQFKTLMIENHIKLIIPTESPNHVQQSVHTPPTLVIDSQLKSELPGQNIATLMANGHIENKKTLILNTQLNGLLVNNTVESSNALNSLSSIYNRWTGKNLKLENIEDYLFQANDNFSNPLNRKNKNFLDFELSSNISMTLDSLKTLNTGMHLNEILEQIELSSQLTANIKQPFQMPNIGWIKGTVENDFTTKNGSIESYTLKAEGEFHRTYKITAIDGWTIKDKKPEKSEQLRHFEFSVQSQIQNPLNAHNLKNLPFILSVHSANPANERSGFSIESQGKVNVTTDPEVIIQNGQLVFSGIQIEPIADQKMTNLSGQSEFSGLLTSRVFQLTIPNLQLNGNFINPAQHIFIEEASIQAKELMIESANITSLPNSLKASAKNIQIQADLDYNDKNQEKIALKNAQLWLTNPIIEPKIRDPKTDTQNTVADVSGYKFNSKYRFKAQQINQKNLFPLSWVLRGNISLSTSNAFSIVNQLNLKGSISNQAGLVVFHNAFYQPRKANQLYADWEVPTIYFLAGNPIQKTFVEWPSLLTLGSGQLKAKGNSQFAFNSPEKKAKWSDSLYTKAEFNVLGLSGIYNETTFNQISTQLNINLKESQLDANIHQLDLLQLNHGIILGPIMFSGDYQTHFDSVSKGRLTLHKLQSNLFNGQAWLDSQIMDLSKPINSTLHLSDIDVSALLDQYPSTDIRGTGKLNGNLPFTVNLKKPLLFTLDNGAIKANSPGGFIQYQAPDGVKQTHQSMKLVFNVLEDFRYSVLSSNVTYGKNQKLLISLSLQGKNPTVENGRQVNFNINLEEDLPALITTMQLSNQVSETIKKRIQEKLQP